MLCYAILILHIVHLAMCFRDTPPESIQERFRFLGELPSKQAP